jgi:hypothetical protein
MRELLSIIADIATIVTACCAVGFLIKINVNVSDVGNKKANQSAKGDGNSQNIRQ